MFISTPHTPAVIGPLLEVSARLGRTPHLVQAATGNTSLKRDGTLWIKASGRWLADAIRDEIFFPLNLEKILRRIEAGEDPSGRLEDSEKPWRTSVETAMHAVLPHKVVIHVHSVNTIAWAVRADGPAELARRMGDIPWQWVPYTRSGLPLARAVQDAMARTPDARVLVLANHGLVVGGDDCEDAEGLLGEVERRTSLAVRRLQPASCGLERIAGQSEWQLPEDPAFHALATDPVAHRIVTGGILYPCQRLFLTPRALSFSESVDGKEIQGLNEPFVIIENTGVLLRKGLSAGELAILNGLVETLRRIPESAPIRYLTDAEIQDLFAPDACAYTEVPRLAGAV